MTLHVILLSITLLLTEGGASRYLMRQQLPKSNVTTLS
jgi:hypothetical protein